MKIFLACLIVPTMLTLVMTVLMVSAFYFFLANLLEQDELDNK